MKFRDFAPSSVVLESGVLNLNYILKVRYLLRACSNDPHKHVNLGEISRRNSGLRLFAVVFLRNLESDPRCGEQQRIDAC